MAGHLPDSGVDRKPAPASAGRFGFIDVLRLIAATLVVIQHVFEEAANPGLRGVVEVAPGVFGVALFFLVSGFVMPLSIKRGFDPFDFALRRIFRIYPGLLTAFAIWAFVGWIVPGAGYVLRRASFADWMANIFLYHDFVGANSFLGVTWTLILEFAWYALFAGSIWLFRERGMAILSRWAPVVMLVLIMISFFSGHRLPLGRLGMIYAAIVGMQTYRRFVGDISQRQMLIDAGLFVLLMAIGNLIAFGYYHHPKVTVGEAVWPWLIAPGIFFSTLIPAIRNSRFFRSRTLAWFGAVSFSIYLLHPIAMALCAPAPFGIGAMMAIPIVTLLLAFPVYYGVERPGIELGRMITHHRGNRVAVEAI